MLALSVRDEPGESSQWAASRKQELGQCDVCTEQRTAHLITELPCDHKYCQDCVVRLYTDALTGESLFPPRCCRQPIPIDLAKPLLPPRLACLLDIYLSSIFVADKDTCPNCKATTCVTCKAAAHQVEDCPSDETTQQLLELAQQQGWRQCYSCHRLVELNLGCNHISKSAPPSFSS
ncbi:ibr finger domain containing protein [Ilyonectria robusta]